MFRILKAYENAGVRVYETKLHRPYQQTYLWLVGYVGAGLSVEILAAVKPLNVFNVLFVSRWRQCGIIPSAP